MSDPRRHDSWTRDYRLSHCEGYAVHSPEGRVGYVEQVVPPPELGEPVTLRIRTGHDGEPTFSVIPIDVVREVLPWREQILVEGSSDSSTTPERRSVVAETKMQFEARRGDLLVVHGHAVGKPERTGEILEVLGEPGHEHYRVRWEDERETLVYPSSDVRVRRKKR